MSGVTLVLGTDGLQAQAAAASSGSASDSVSTRDHPGLPAKTYAQGACIN